MAAPNLAVAINYRAREAVHHRTPSRIEGGAAGDLAKLVTWYGTYGAAQITSQVGYVVVNDHYGQTHTAGTENSVRVVMRDDSGGQYRVDFRHLAAGKTVGDVQAAFTGDGVLLPNSQAQCTSASVTVVPL